MIGTGEDGVCVVVGVVVDIGSMVGSVVGVDVGVLAPSTGNRDALML